MKHITIVAGARPNFMKIAPILRELKRFSGVFKTRLVHTGQHYDDAMNAVFFRELGIPEPDVRLNGSGGTHAQQTARIMVEFEADCMQVRPDIVLVVGDVNSTLACAIVAKKLHIPLAHVEAGLRSGDMAMPEEINRRVTDSISDLFFVTEPSGVDNLLREGHSAEAIFHVGHVMVDNLFYQRDRLAEFDFSTAASGRLKKGLSDYGVVTLHRPSNVDNPESLNKICVTISDIAKDLPLIFSLHPRTKKNIEKFGISFGDGVHVVDPLPYMEFLNLWKDARVILTDSGGLQEESTALGVPCLTLRESTERPITVTAGTNKILGKDMKALKAETQSILNGYTKRGAVPELWDGLASQRIVSTLLSYCIADV